MGARRQDSQPSDQCPLGDRPQQALLPRRLPFTPLPALFEIVREPYCGPFERRPASSRVNRVRNDDPDVLLPVPVSALF